MLYLCRTIQYDDLEPRLLFSYVTRYMVYVPRALWGFGIVSNEHDFIACVEAMRFQIVWTSYISPQTALILYVIVPRAVACTADSNFSTYRNEC